MWLAEQREGHSNSEEEFFCWSSATPSHLFDDDLATPVNSAVVDHIDDSDSQVTADPEWDAEAEAAHDGDDVPPRKPEARAVAQRRFLLLYLRGPPVFGQLNNFTGFLLPFHHPVIIHVYIYINFKHTYSITCSISLNKKKKKLGCVRLLHKNGN